MTTGAADFMFRCASAGSLSMSDMNIERRPYHKNCKCALHDLKGKCSHAYQQLNSVSFPKREFKNTCSIKLSASTISSQSSCVGDTSLRYRESVDEVWVDCTCRRELCKKAGARQLVQYMFSAIILQQYPLPKVNQIAQRRIITVRFKQIEVHGKTNYFNKYKKKCYISYLSYYRQLCSLMWLIFGSNRMPDLDVHIVFFFCTKEKILKLKFAIFILMDYIGSTVINDII